MRRLLPGLLVASLALLGLGACARPTATPLARAAEPSPTRQSPTSEAPSTTPEPTQATPSPTLPPPPSATAKPSPTATLSPSPTSTLTPRPPTATATRPAPSPTSSPVPTSPAPSAPHVWGLVVTPDDPPRLYAVVGEVLYRSDNRGASWQTVRLSGVPDRARILSVALDYRHPDVMYLTTSAGIFRRQGEAAWTFVHPLIATALAVDLRNADILWAGASFTTEYNAVLLKSTDSGRTWGKADFGMEAWQRYGVSHIAIDPVDPNIMYANLRYGGRFGWPEGWVYRGGQDGHWERLSFGQTPAGDSPCKANGLAFDPDLRRLYVGCDAYYYNQGQLILMESDNAHAPDSSRVSWRTVRPLGQQKEPVVYGAVRALAVDARTPKSVYVAVTFYRANESVEQQVIMVSHDDGATWQELALPQTSGE